MEPTTDVMSLVYLVVGSVLTFVAQYLMKLSGKVKPTPSPSPSPDSPSPTPAEPTRPLLDLLLQVLKKRLGLPSFESLPLAEPTPAVPDKLSDRELLTLLEKLANEQSQERGI